MSDPHPPQNATPSSSEKQFTAPFLGKRKMTPRVGLAADFPVIRAILKDINDGPANENHTDERPENELEDYEKSDGITDQMADEMADETAAEGLQSDNHIEVTPTPAMRITKRGNRHSNRPVTSFRPENLLHRNKNPSTAFSQVSGVSYIQGKPDVLSTPTMDFHASFQKFLSSCDAPVSPARPRSQSLDSRSRNRILSSTHDAREATDLLTRRKSLVNLSLAHRDKKQLSMTLDETAKALGQGIDEDVANWKVYLESYCNGHYNLNKPPRPNVPMGLEYLPAPYPGNEKDRTAVAMKYVNLWSLVDTHKVMDSVGQVAERLRASHVAISFFTQEREIRMAESVHNDKNREREVPRGMSLLAHTLYSHQVLVVLNTLQDWRFCKSPLVTGWPHIEFFASAPIIVDNQVIGAVGVFDTMPHSSFHRDEEDVLVRLGQYIVHVMDSEIEVGSPADHDNCQFVQLPGEWMTPPQRTSRRQEKSVSNRINNITGQRSVSTPATFLGSAPSRLGDDQHTAPLLNLWTNQAVSSTECVWLPSNEQYRNSHAGRDDEYPAERYDTRQSPSPAYQSGNNERTASSPLLYHEQRTSIEQPKTRRKSLIPFANMMNKTVLKFFYTPHLHDEQLNDPSQDRSSGQTSTAYGDVPNATSDESQFPASALPYNNQSPNGVPLPRSVSNSDSERTIHREHNAASVGQGDRDFITTSTMGPQTMSGQMPYDIPSRTLSQKMSQKLFRQKSESTSPKFPFALSFKSSKDTPGSVKEPHVKGSSRIHLPGLGIALQSPILCSPNLRNPIVFTKATPPIEYDPSVHSHRSDTSSIRSVDRSNTLSFNGTPSNPFRDPSQLFRNSWSTSQDASQVFRTPSNASYQINKDICACYQIAVSLGYDLVYIMAVEASRPPSKDQILLKIKAIYPEGAHKDVQEKMSSEQRDLHGLALFMGSMTCDVKKNKLGNLTWGTLIPLLPIDPSKRRATGLVLGAFRSSKKPDGPEIVSQIEQTLYFAVEPCIQDQTAKEAKRARKELEKHRESYNSNSTVVAQNNMSTGYSLLVKAQRGMGREKKTLRREPRIDNLRSQENGYESLRRDDSTRTSHTSNRVEDQDMMARTSSTRSSRTSNRVEDQEICVRRPKSTMSAHSSNRVEDQEIYVRRPESTMSAHSSNRIEDQEIYVRRPESTMSAHSSNRIEDQEMIARSFSTMSARTNNRVEDQEMMSCSSSVFSSRTNSRIRDQEVAARRSASSKSSQTGNRVEDQEMMARKSSMSSHTGRRVEDRMMDHRDGPVHHSRTRNTGNSIKRASQESVYKTLLSDTKTPIHADRVRTKPSQAPTFLKEDPNLTSHQPALKSKKSEFDQRARMIEWVWMAERSELDRIELEESKKARRHPEEEPVQQQRTSDDSNARAGQSLDEEKRLPRKDGQMADEKRVSLRDKPQSTFQQPSRDSLHAGESAVPRGRAQSSLKSSPRDSRVFAGESAPLRDRPEPTFQQLPKEERNLRGERNRRTYMRKGSGAALSHKTDDSTNQTRKPERRPDGNDRSGKDGAHHR